MIESNQEKGCCKNIDHKEVYYQTKTRDENNQAKFVKQKNEESKHFMAYFCDNIVSDDVWFFNSGCFNHMSGIRLLFKEVDESQMSEMTQKIKNILKLKEKAQFPSLVMVKSNCWM